MKRRCSCVWLGAVGGVADIESWKSNVGEHTPIAQHTTRRRQAILHPTKHIVKEQPYLAFLVCVRLIRLQVASISRVIQRPSMAVEPNGPGDNDEQQ